MYISVIIAAHNNAQHLDRGLTAVQQSNYADFEIIVVDDGSTDNSVMIARTHQVKLICLHEKHGPAAARNRGALEARGELLVFVAPDVLIQRWSLSIVSHTMLSHPEVAAVFGIYDDQPLDHHFLTQFRNLLRLFHFLDGDIYSSWFWAGCGAVRRDLFMALRGFDPRWQHIEDMELGYRMRKAGCLMFLNKSLQVKMLKRWRWGPTLYRDITGIAIPWSHWILQADHIPNDLGFRPAHRQSALILAVLISIVPFLFSGELLVMYAAGLISAILWTMFFWLNREFYAFLATRRNRWFVACAILYHVFHYIYLGAGFICGCLLHVLGRSPGPRLDSQPGEWATPKAGDAPDTDDAKRC